MKRKFKVVIMLLLTAVTSAIFADAVQTADKNSDANISIMTFNVRYGTAKDDNNSWPYRKFIAIEAIEKYCPNLLGVQECLTGQADYILEKVPMYYYYGIGREADGLGEMEGEFYNKTLFSPIEMGTFWLSETPGVPGSKSWGAACTRTATWMKLRYLPADKYFYWVNTHFDHISEEARQGAAKMLLEKINSMAGDLPVIITGDFNSPEDSAAWKTLINGGFKDSWQIAEQKSGPEVTWHDYMKNDITVKNRIDWILVRGIKNVKKCETITFTNNGQCPSDHFPVYAELTL